MQLEILLKYAEPIRLSTLASSIHEGKLYNRSFAITFDDGYIDNLTHAMPILEEFHIPATIFITTGYVAHQGRFWWDELQELFLHTDPIPRILHLETDKYSFHLDLQYCADYDQHDLEQDFNTKPWKAAPGTRLDCYHKTWKFLKSLSHEERLSALQRIAKWSRRELPDFSSDRPMKKSELLSLMGSDLIDLGAHSKTHVSLPECSTDQRYQEIAGSANDLQTLTGQYPETFAYPHGEFDKESKQMAKKCGFLAACTTSRPSPPVVHSASDPLALPRVQAINTNARKFECQIRAFLDA